MSDTKIPNEWDLGAHRRYKLQNMERAMRGKIERGLVELITNSDDNYRDLEDEGKQVSGKIRIEIERRKKGQPTIVVVRDRAGGMNKAEMFHKLGALGERTSGFEKGKARRGLHGRGARDIVAFGTVHFESIKDDEYNHLIIPPSLKCRFAESRQKKASPDIRKKMGIPKGNGTVVTVEVAGRFKILQHETFLRDFSRYYSLRDILSNFSREVSIVDIRKGRTDPLVYRYPAGEVVFDDKFVIPEYPKAIAHLIIRKHDTPFEQEQLLPYREGILIKSPAAIHDCTYFGLESEPLSWRFTGTMFCEFIDELIREYDNREEENPDSPGHPENNPMRLLDPFRDGLILEHPFTQALYKKCKGILHRFIDQLKATESPYKRDVSDENLERKLNNLSNEISKIFEKKLHELEEDILTMTVDDPRMKKLGIGLHIIPSEQYNIIANEPKTFSIIVKHYEALDESLPLDVISSDPENVKVGKSPVFLKKFLEDGKIGRTTFVVEGSKVGSEAFIEARYGGYEKTVRLKVVGPLPPPPLPDGLSFENSVYHLRINKEKTLTLRLKTTLKRLPEVIANIASNNPEIVVKGGGRCELRATDAGRVLEGKCKILGRQLKARGEIMAFVKGFDPARAIALVEEQEPPSGVNLKFKPVEEDFGSVRYKWDEKEPYFLKIGATHPSIRRYLGEWTKVGYPGIGSDLYHSVLAEVIAEALSFRILEKQFKREGQEGMLDYASTDLYYHKHFSDFLAVTHKNLVAKPAEE